MATVTQKHEIPKSTGDFRFRVIPEVLDVRASTSEPWEICQDRASELPHEDQYAAFEQTLYALCKAKRDREAIAEALDYFDDRLTSGRFADCNRAFRQLQVARLASSVLVSILGVSVRQKKSRSRANFFKRSFHEIARQKGMKYAIELLFKYR